MADDALEAHKLLLELFEATLLLVYSPRRVCDDKVLPEMHRLLRHVLDRLHRIELLASVRRNDASAGLVADGPDLAVVAKHILHVVRLVAEVRFGYKNKPCVLQLRLCAKPLDVRGQELVDRIGALATEGVHANNDNAVILDNKRDKAHLAVATTVRVAGDENEQGQLAKLVARPVEERIHKLLAKYRHHVFGDHSHALPLQELRLVAVDCLDHVELLQRLPWRDLVRHVRASLRVLASLAGRTDQRDLESVE